MDNDKMTLQSTAALFANATTKADRFGADSDKSIRAQAKQAILQELNQQLRIRAEKIKLRDKTNSSLIESDIEIDGAYSEHPISYANHIQLSKMSVLKREKTAKVKVTTPSRIPTRMPRLRRRDNISTTKPVKAGQPGYPRNVVKNYKPGYTWNKGGRVKELRIRCIARKFFHLWQSKTFGRVLPSVARKHYEASIVRKLFGVWYDLWWEARKEWRLNVRADLHNRYRLWSRVWRAWQDYTLDHRVKTTLNRMADKHAEHNQLLRGLRAWVVYTSVRRDKKALYEKADLTYRKRLVRNVWGTWRCACRRRQEKRNQDVVALQFWAHKLTSQHWFRWREALVRKRLEDDKYQVACHHHNITQKRKAMEAWIVYHRSRQTKLEHYEYAADVDRKLTLRVHFRYWRQRWDVAQAMSHYHQQITELARSATCRRWFLRWRQYISEQEQQRENTEVADQHYRNILLKTMFGALKLNVAQQRLKVVRSQMADEFCVKQTMKRAWMTWMNSLEEKEDIRMIPATRKALLHHRQVVQEKMWKQWRFYTEWRKNRQAQYIYADMHYRVQTLPRLMFHWRHFVELRHRKHELAEMAESFAREKSQAKSFYQWYNAYKESQDIRMLERMAILHYDSSIKKKAFVVWSKRTQVALEDALKWDVASEHYDVTISTRTFFIWKTHVREIKQNFLNTQKASRHHYLTMVGKAWLTWKINVRRKKEKQLKICSAEQHYHQRLLARVLVGWKNYHAWWLELEGYVSVKLHEKNQLRLRHALHKWYTNAQLQKLENEKQQMAVNHHSNNLLGQVFHAWRRYAVVHAHKKHKTAAEVDEKKAILNKGILRRMFGQWKTSRDDALLGRLKYEQAAQHRSNTLRNKAWALWRLFTKQRLRKQLQQRQCVWLHNTRLTAKFFLQWRAAYHQAQQYHSQDALALWQWSLTLQRKVLLAWFEFNREKKRKKARISEALERRRIHMLRTGVSKWLAVASDMVDIRQRLAARQGAQKYFKIHQVVLRCASHWRQVTARNRAKRNGTAHAQTLIKKPAPPAVSSLLPLSSAGSPLRSRHSDTDAIDRLGDKSIRQVHSRPAPRRPAFLIESLKRDGLYVNSPNKQDRSESSEEEVLLEKSVREPIMKSASAGETPDLTSQISPRTKKVRFASSHQTGDGDKHSGEKSAGHSHVLQRSKLKVNEFDVNTEPRPPLPATYSDATRPSVLDKVQLLSPYDSYESLEDNTSTQSDIARTETDSNFTHIINPVHTLKLDKERTDNEEQPDKISAVQIRTDMNPLFLQTKTSSQKPAMNLELIPPDAFLCGRDGSSLLPGNTAPSVTGHVNPFPHNCDISTSTGLAIKPFRHCDHNQPQVMYSPSIKPETKPEMHPDHVTLLSPAEEILAIRHKLHIFQQQKQKLKVTQEQQAQLLNWLNDQSGHDRDPDVLQVKDELNNLAKDIELLRATISSTKPEAVQLARRVRELLPTVQQ